MKARYSNNFTVSELQCPTAKIIRLETGFIECLEELRRAYGRPMPVSSGCRTTEHNEYLIKRGYKASPNSLHLINNLKYCTDTCAVDILRPSMQDFQDLSKLAKERGWTIGIADTFIHLDLRSVYTSLPQIVYYY